MLTFFRNIVVVIAIFLATIFTIPEIEPDNLSIDSENVIEETTIVEDAAEDPKDFIDENLEKKKLEVTEVVVTKKEIEINSGNLGSDLIDLMVPITPVNTPIETNTISISEVNKRTRNALVNIICTTGQGGLLQPITGSGIVIDERGVILTNAHIAQYFLLKDYIVPNYLDCKIRTGSPAVNSYDVELLFISPTWVRNNYEQINTSNPKGTGENDFALLLITKSIRLGVELPKIFPYVSPNLKELEPKVGDIVVVAGYPAGFLSGISIQKDLYAVSTVTNIKDVFTFIKDTLDLFSIGGSIAAQKGSSGGGIVNTNGELLGIVVTASVEKQTDDRDLRAITLSHISRSLKKDSGFGLKDYLTGDLLAKSDQFKNNTAPELTSLLESALDN
jgi:hypothetical protein